MDGVTGRDADLVERAREGDLGAFDRLVARHRMRLYAIARQITGDREAAQDLVQECFLRAFRSLGALREHHRIGQWLNTIVRREAQAWLRDGQRRPEPMDTAGLRGMPAIWQVASGVPGELAERVGSALTVLTERERQVMILHYLEGRSCEEIGGRLKLSTGSVKRILHYSRRKVREECEAMTAMQREPGPRKLDYWIAGNCPDNQWSVFRRMGHGSSASRSGHQTLAHTICLAVNKKTKTVDQVAAEVGAHPEYVGEAAESLLEIDVLTSPAKGKLLASFIAFDAEDWRRLMSLVREPAAQAAKRFAAGEQRLRSAFESTPLAASGWSWQEVIWVVYPILVANMGTSRAEPPANRPTYPERPGGGYYWIGGHEVVPDFRPVWQTGFNTSGHVPGLGWGYWWSAGLERKHTGVFGADETRQVVGVFADGPLSEAEALARLGDDRERWRAAIAAVVQAGFLAKADGRYRLTVPVFRQQDSDVLTPEVDAVVAPVVSEITEPALRGADGMLDEMGYGHRRDQYAIWHGWLTHQITGEALHFLVEQGVLPAPPAPAPENFAVVTWKGDLPLMSWGSA